MEDNIMSLINFLLVIRKHDVFNLNLIVSRTLIPTSFCFPSNAALVYYATNSVATYKYVLEPIYSINNWLEVYAPHVKLLYRTPFLLRPNNCWKITQERVNRYLIYCCGFPCLHLWETDFNCWSLLSLFWMLLPLSQPYRSTFIILDFIYIYSINKTSKLGRKEYLFGASANGLYTIRCR